MFCAGFPPRSLLFSKVISTYIHTIPIFGLIKYTAGGAPARRLVRQSFSDGGSFGAGGKRSGSQFRSKKVRAELYNSTKSKNNPAGLFLGWCPLTNSLKLFAGED